MASRSLIIASLLGASVGVPYLASQSQHKPATMGGVGTASNVSSGGSSSAWIPTSTVGSQPWSPMQPTMTPVSSGYNSGNVPTGGFVRLPPPTVGTLPGARTPAID